MPTPTPSGGAPPTGAHAESSARPPVALVGAGAVGRALAHRLRDAGYPLAAVLSRSTRSAQQLAAEVGAAAAAASAPEALPREARLVFLCVPDDQVRPVAEALAGQAHPWARCLVAHTSGALPAEALYALAEAGAATLSFHPMQAFPPGATSSAFDGIYVGLEGGEEALRAGRAVAEAIAVEAVAVPVEAKTRYHLAASMTSGLLVTLLAVAGDVLEGALSGQGSSTVGDGGVDGAAVLRPLLEGTLRNVQERGPADALTGPAVRGDEDTIAAHLRALQAHHPGLLPVYAALTTETVRLGARSGRLAEADAERLLDRLEAALEPSRGLPS